MTSPKTLLTLLSAAAVTAAVCGAGPATAAAPQGLADPLPGSLPVAATRVGVQLAGDGFVEPTSLVTAPGVPYRLYVTDQPGVIYAVGKGSKTPGHGKVFADLRSLIVPLGDASPGSPYDERGLLGLAFAPDYQQSGLLYTYSTQRYTRTADFSTEPGNTQNCRGYDPTYLPHPCQNVVTEWKVRDPHDPDTTVNPASARELLRIDKPEFNHNAGALAFGPDGYLYISTGDGGYGDDQGKGHVPGGNAQSLAPGNVLGKILRIDPRGRNAANGRYGIPTGNPFIGRPGADEIWAYGLRNPYRMSFDPLTGDLWTADTGQNEIEEVDKVVAGGNYGWHLKEGTFTFAPGSPTNFDDGTVTANNPGSPARLIDPVAEYDHTGPHGTINGEAIVGGYTYRGSAIPALAGKYVFGDYSPGADTGTPLGRLFITGDTPWRPGANTTALPVGATGNLKLFLLGFGQDSDGELYVLANATGTLAGHTGVIERITAG